MIANLKDRSGAQVVGVLAVAVVVSQLMALAFGQHALIPWAFMAESAVYGCVSALLAVAIVLIYRANRIITFAHGTLATSASMLMFVLLGEGWSYWAAIPFTIACTTAAGALIEVGLLRRFATAPRLVVTVVTLAAGQVFVVGAFLLPLWRFDVNLIKASIEDLARLPREPVEFPIDWSWKWAPITFTSKHLVAVVVSLVVLAAIGVFLRYTTAGTAIRGAAENSERVALLGVGMGALGTLVWVIAGVLAGLTAVLGQQLSGSSLATLSLSVGAGTLLRALAAAVLARMERVGVAVAAAIGIAVFDRAVYWVTNRTATSDLVLLGIIAVALLVQRRRLSRTEESATTTWDAAEEIRPIPEILTRLPSVQAGRRWAFGVVAVLALGFPWAMSPSEVVIGATYATYGIVLVSLVVLTGWGGQISLGQFGFVAAGASVGGALTASVGLPFPIAMLGAALAGAAVAIVLGLPALRIRGLYLAVTTLGFAVVMSTFVLDIKRFPALVQEKLTRPQLGPIDFNDERAYFYLCLGCLVLAVLAAQGLRRTRTGRVLIAARDNERAVQSFGVSLVRTRLATFALSGFLAGGAGMLLAHQQLAVQPEQYEAGQSIDMFLMAIIGGLGSVTGVLTGAVYIAIVSVIFDEGLWPIVAVSGGVLVILVAYPAGLGGVLFSIRDAWLRRIAIREKIFVRSLLGDVRDLTSERSRAQLTPKPAPEPTYELVDSEIRSAGESQRAKGWVYG